MKYIFVFVLILILNCQPKNKQPNKIDTKNDSILVNLDFWDHKKIKIPYSKLNIDNFISIESLEELPKTFINSFKHGVMFSKNELTLEDSHKYKIHLAGKNQNTYLIIVSIQGHYYVELFVGYNQDSIPYLFTLDYGLGENEYDLFDSIYTDIKLDFAQKIVPTDTNYINRIKRK